MVGMREWHTARLIGGMVLVCLMTAGGTAWAGDAREEPTISRGIRAYDEFQYETAMHLLEQALVESQLTTEERATGHLYLGMARFTLGDWDLAGVEFKQALAIDFGLLLPPGTSPKIRAAFEEIRQLLGSSASAANPPSSVDDEPSTDERATTRNSRLWAWITGGIGVASLVAGGTLGNLAREGKRDFDQEPWVDRAADLKQTVEQQSLAANILFGVGGAAIAAAVVLFFVEGGSRSNDEVSPATVFVTPTPGGVAASFRF